VYWSTDHIYPLYFEPLNESNRYFTPARQVLTLKNC